MIEKCSTKIGFRWNINYYYYYYFNGRGSHLRRRHGILKLK